MQDHSSFPAQDLWEKVANLNQKRTNNEASGSCSTAAHAGKISPGVGSFVAGGFGLKAFFIFLFLFYFFFCACEKLKCP